MRKFPMLCLFPCRFTTWTSSSRIDFPSVAWKRCPNTARPEEVITSKNHENPKIIWMKKRRTLVRLFISRSKHWESSSTTSMVFLFSLHSRLYRFVSLFFILFFVFSYQSHRASIDRRVDRDPPPFRHEPPERQVGEKERNGQENSTMFCLLNFSPDLLWKILPSIFFPFLHSSSLKFCSVLVLLGFPPDCLHFVLLFLSSPFALLYCPLCALFLLSFPFCSYLIKHAHRNGAFFLQRVMKSSNLGYQREKEKKKKKKKEKTD